MLLLLMHISVRASGVWSIGSFTMKLCSWRQWVPAQYRSITYGLRPPYSNSGTKVMAAFALRWELLVFKRVCIGLGGLRFDFQGW